jgi:hypothetical protein
MRTSILDLPLEIIALILENIPCVFTLLLATRACRTFRYGFKIREDHIIASSFNREWRQRGSYVDYNNCGRLLRELIALAPTECVSPALVERLVDNVWSRFESMYLEESLIPVCVAAARSYIRNDQTDSAISLLDSMWNDRRRFPWSVPGSIGRDFDDDEQFEYARQRKRIGLFPVGMLLVKLLNGRGRDTTVLQRGLKHLRREFRRSPVLLIGIDQVALFPSRFIPSSLKLLEDGILFNTSANNLPGSVKAIVRITRWGSNSLQEHPNDTVKSITGIYRLGRTNCSFSELGTRFLYNPGQWLCFMVVLRLCDSNGESRTHKLDDLHGKVSRRHRSR